MRNLPALAPNLLGEIVVALLGSRSSNCNASRAGQVDLDMDIQRRPHSLQVLEHGQGFPPGVIAPGHETCGGEGTIGSHVGVIDGGQQVGHAGMVDPSHLPTSTT